MIMSMPIDGPNPLRPYYVPPSPRSPSFINGELPSPISYSSKNVSSSTSSSRSLGSSARNILADMDYTDYLSDASPSPREIGRSLVEHAIWKYTSIFLAQPFDVAKIVLQAQKGGTGQRRIKDTATDDPRKPSRNQRRDPYEVFL